ncbi:MAG: transposase [Pirellulales bacterium]
MRARSIGQTPLLEQWGPPRLHERRHGPGGCPNVGRVRRMLFQLLDHNAKAEDFVRFLNTCGSNWGRELHVVWDNLGAHRRAENVLREIGCQWAHFHRLPLPMPELNPVEHVWTTSKWGRLANAPPNDLDHLDRQVDAELARQARQQRILQAHFR